MLAAWSTSPSHTRRAASMLAPTTWRLASCIPGKVGSSSVPSPRARSITPGSALLAITASISSASWTVARSSSLASGASTTSSWSSTPSSRARATVRSTRIGFIGCVGPKVYPVSDSSYTRAARQLSASGALPSVIAGGERTRTVAGGFHGRDERGPHLVVLELADRRGRRTSRRGDLLAQHGRVRPGLAQELGRADDGLHDELGRGGAGQAEVDAGLDHGLDHEEEV